jgi:hypothetical protein
MEKRLIDANPIYDKVEANYRMSEGVQHECEREFLNLLCNAPTVYAAPVVRCEKCSHGIKNHGISDGWVLCTKPYVTDTVGAMMHPNDWFCADGKRKDGERDGE